MMWTRFPLKRRTSPLNLALPLVTMLGLAAVAPLGCTPQGKSASSAGIGQHTAIQWEPSFEAAQKKARAANKPIMVDFYTDWCGWCKELDAKTYTAREVIDESQNFVSVKVNAEQRTDLALRYKVDGFPTILWVDSSGTELDRLPGYAESREFARFMRGVQSKFTTAV